MKRNELARIVLIGLVLPIGTLVSSAIAQVRPPELADPLEPGSVIVFPKFIRGVVTPSGAAVTPKTEIAVTVVCPQGATCTEGQPIKMRFHWVCGTDENPTNSFVCREGDFDVRTTINGTAVFNPERLKPWGNVLVPLPPCERGYLIGWVENLADQPIKFDGLIGNAVLRESPWAISSYNAIPIQADPALAQGALITKDSNGGLVFDGGPGHYLAVTGVVYADVAFDKLSKPSRSTFLTLLTLDTNSNRPNYPTFVDLDFYSSQEVLLSTFTEFVCWGEAELSRQINPSLTAPGMGARKGSVVSGPAVKVPIGGIADTAGPVTLLGLVETLEGNSERSYINGLSNDSVVVPTTFVPN